MKIYIMRHFEKPNNNKSHDLSPIGREHAKVLAKYPPKQFKHLSSIYTFKTKHQGRGIETVEPLAQKLNVAVQAEYPSASYEDEVTFILNEIGKNLNSDQQILICWEHHHIPLLTNTLISGLAQSLNQKAVTNVPNSWEGTNFSDLWEIDCSDKNLTFQTFANALSVETLKAAQPKLSRTVGICHFHKPKEHKEADKDTSVPMRKCIF